MPAGRRRQESKPTPSEDNEVRAIRNYTAAEVAQHNKVEDLWLIIHGRVYDVTKFVDEHPGGGEVSTPHSVCEYSKFDRRAFHLIATCSDHSIPFRVLSISTLSYSNCIIYIYFFIVYVDPCGKCGARCFCGI